MTTPPSKSVRVHRGQRPDGTWEVWLDNEPEQALKGLGRAESFLAYLCLRLARPYPARPWWETWR